MMPLGASVFSMVFGVETWRLGKQPGTRLVSFAQEITGGF